MLEPSPPGNMPSASWHKYLSLNPAPSQRRPGKPVNECSPGISWTSCYPLPWLLEMSCHNDIWLLWWTYVHPCCTEESNQTKTQKLSYKNQEYQKLLTYMLSKLKSKLSFQYQNKQKIRICKNLELFDQTWT